MRRTGCIVISIAAALALGMVIWLLSGVLGAPAEISTRDARFAQLLSAAPRDTNVLVVGSAGPFWTSLREDEILGPLIVEEAGTDLDLAAVLLGRSSLAVWRTDEGAGFASDVRGVRRSLVQLVARFSASMPPLVPRGELLVGGTVAGASGRDVQRLADAGGTALLVHSESKSAAWPPLDPPVVTAFKREGEHLTVRSIAPRTSGHELAGTPFPFEIPTSAAATFVFTRPGEGVKMLEAIIPLDLRTLGANGLALAIWDVETGGLLPRPRGVVLVPRTADSEQAVSRLFSTALYPEQLGLLAGRVSSREFEGTKIDRLERLGMTTEAASVGATLVIAFDDSSMDRFLESGREPLAPRAGAVWRAVVDVDRTAPILSAISEDRALAIIAKDLQRSIREFDRILRRFRGAGQARADRIQEAEAEVFELVLGGDPLRTAPK